MDSRRRRRDVDRESHDFWDRVSPFLTISTSTRFHTCQVCICSLYHAVLLERVPSVMPLFIRRPDARGLLRFGRTHSDHLSTGYPYLPYSTYRTHHVSPVMVSICYD